MIGLVALRRSAEPQGVQKKWEQDVPGNIIKADKNWPDFAEVISAELGTCRAGGGPDDAGL